MELLSTLLISVIRCNVILKLNLDCFKGAFSCLSIVIKSNMFNMNVAQHIT